jgi:23S rRNA (guanine745-N1)-methyltransferase
MPEVAPVSICRGFSTSSTIDTASCSISKHAARYAARANERGTAIVTDVWGRLPLRDATAALVVSVFAPRNAEEFARILVPSGALLVVTPTPGHLRELVGPLGLISIDPLKQERLDGKFAPLFAPAVERRVEYTANVSRPLAIAAA